MEMSESAAIIKLFFHSILAQDRCGGYTASGSGASSLASASGGSEAQASPPETEPMDRLFWTALIRSAWSRWAEVLLIVKPETVVGWHRAGFRLYWRWQSRGRAPGRATITAEIPGSHP